MKTQAARETRPESTGLYNPTWWERTRNAWIERPRQDVTVSILLFGVLFGLAIWRHFLPLGWIDVSSRHALYQTAIAMSVTLAGFTLTSISVLVNLLRNQLPALDRLIIPAAKKRIGYAFLDCLWATAAVFFAAIIGFVHDGNSTSNDPKLWVETLFISACAFAALRFCRISGILRLLIGVST